MGDKFFQALYTQLLGSACSMTAQILVIPQLSWLICYYHNYYYSIIIIIIRSRFLSVLSALMHSGILSGMQPIVKDDFCFSDQKDQST